MRGFTLNTAHYYHLRWLCGEGFTECYHSEGRNGHKTRAAMNVSVIYSANDCLIQLRRTAWKKALIEYEWFTSLPGTPFPEDIKDWWQGQLDVDKEGNVSMPYGYGEAWRGSKKGGTDQLAYILGSIKRNPNSRRHVVSLWMPERTTVESSLPVNMPPPCHGSLIVFSVEDTSEGRLLHMSHTQRSGDMILGVPHNMVQYGALLQYVAFHTGCLPGGICYNVVNAHIYEAHAKAIETLLISEEVQKRVALEGEEQYKPIGLKYNYSGEVDVRGIPVFKASDFSLTGKPEWGSTARLPLIV